MSEIYAKQLCYVILVMSQSVKNILSSHALFHLSNFIADTVSVAGTRAVADDLRRVSLFPLLGYLSRMLYNCSLFFTASSLEGYMKVTLQ